MRHIYPPPFLKPALSVFMMFFAISFVKAQSIELGGKYANSQIGHYKYGAYYDVMADGTRLLGTATASMRAKFEWFNFDNDRYIDAYSPNYVWWGNETHVYNSSNCVLESKASYGYQAIDFNNDGRSDIKFGARYWYNGEYINNTKPEEVFVYAHGQWWPTRVRLLSMEEYRGEQEKMVLHSGTGLGSGMSIVSGSSTAMANSSTQAIDLNSDGYTDFVDAASGLFYQNLSDGRYVLNELGGQLTFRDFNNDGMTDYVLFDSEKKKTSVFLSQTDGTWKERVILSNLYSDEEVYCYDFDKDGDVDILITLSYYVSGHDNGGSFVVMMENQGGGSFKQYEFAMDGRVYFRQCTDLDGDGSYEIVAQKQEEDGNISDLVYYTVKGMDIADTPVLLKGAVEGYPPSDYNCLVADLDNSGRMRVLYGTSTEEIPNVNANTRPVAPDKPRYVYDAGKGTLKVEWGEGRDAECSVADLTYALRIGTVEGEGDMLYAHALADGRRRNLLEGNCGYVRSRTLNVSSWPAGKYYISVQSVDPGRLGSEFSTYAMFEKKEPAADFILSRKYEFSIGDTCTVVLLGDAEPGCTYDWDWGGATVLKQSADGSEYEIVFTEGGEKQISLKVTAASGMFARSEQALDVNPGNVKEHDFGVDPSVWGIDVAADLDEDGRTEIYANSNGKKFYEGNEKGQYSTVKKLWNSNLPSAKYTIADINRDGQVDMVLYEYRESYSLVNGGNGQMTLSPLSMTVGGQPANTYDSRFDDEWRDFNNDGLLEPLHCRNTGDYMSFEDVEGSYKQLISDLLDKDCNVSILIDYDRDGLVDFIDKGYYWEYNIPSITLFRNNGDFTFTPEKLEWIEWDGTAEGLLEDIDGDGRWDFIYYASASGFGNTWYSDHVRVQWGDGETLIIPAEDGVAFGFIQKIADVDNNGCLDMVFSTNQQWGPYLVIYFYKDRSYKIGFMDKVSASGADYLLTDGRLASETTVFSGVTNEKPAAPNQIRASQDGKFVTLEWNHSADKETPNALMRYNISICHKGKTGEGAYLFSLLNSAKNGVHVPSPYNLLTGNKFCIPVQNIPAGEYEVQVQGVDRGMLESDFSEIYQLTVREESLIEMPTSAGVGREIQVKVTDNSGQTVDFGSGSSVKENANGYYTVVWDSEGLKTVKVGSLASQNIYVYPIPQGAFALPEKVLSGATVNLQGENMSKCSWTYSLNGGQPCPVNENPDVTVKALDEHHAVVTFGKAGRYELFHHVADEFNAETYAAETEVDGTNPCPVISIVDIDPESGKYRLGWSVENLPAGAQSINIYKETSRYDEYELLANLPLTETAYTDLSSMPDYSASRYYATCVLPYGESMHSIAHQPIHVMINKGIGNTWNLVWSRYEGREIESYRILGGTSPDNMETIAEVSGHLSSYSNLDASSDMLYYAVETVSGGTPSVRKSVKSSEITACRSNVVCTNDAISAVLARQITVQSDKENLTIDGSAGETSLQLMGSIYPLNATVQCLNWQVTEGGDIATISTSGLLTATGNGYVTVRAYAVDGSGVYGEAQVQVKGLVSVEQIKQKGNRPELKVSYADNRFTILGIPADERATLYVYNTSGCLLKVDNVTGATATIEGGGLPSGILLCRVVTDKWAETVRFIKP